MTDQTPIDPIIYVPTVEEARATWTVAMASGRSHIEPLMRGFDQMISKVRAEAKAEAMKEFTSTIDDDALEIASRKDYPEAWKVVDIHKGESISETMRNRRLSRTKYPISSYLTALKEKS